jgi:hypothetical protein
VLAWSETIDGIAACGCPHFSLDLEAVVALDHDFIELVFVDRETSVEHEYAGLAENGFARVRGAAAPVEAGV